MLITTTCTPIENQDNDAYIGLDKDETRTDGIR